MDLIPDFKSPNKNNKFYNEILEFTKILREIKFNEELTFLDLKKAIDKTSETLFKINIKLSLNIPSVNNQHKWHLFSMIVQKDLKLNGSDLLEKFESVIDKVSFDSYKSAESNIYETLSSFEKPKEGKSKKADEDNEVDISNYKLVILSKLKNILIEDLIINKYVDFKNCLSIENDNLSESDTKYIDYIEQVIQLSVLFEKNNLKVITKHLKNDLLLLLIKFIRELDVNKEIIDEIFTDNVVRQTMMS